LYIMGYVYLNLHGRAHKEAIYQFLTGTSKSSGRLHRCLAYYASISRVPAELLVGYLPMVLLITYVREAALSDSYRGQVELLEETILTLGRNRRQVWHYLDTLTEQIVKEVENRSA
jgi:hypothetical protein